LNEIRVNKLECGIDINEFFFFVEVERHGEDRFSQWVVVDIFKVIWIFGAEEKIVVNSLRDFDLLVFTEYFHSVAILIFIMLLLFLFLLLFGVAEFHKCGLVSGKKLDKGVIVVT
jgi:hypothetical protein